jgi:protein involved in temperature-dependent protein secretion
MWLATRALDVLEAGLQALAEWRSFRLGLHELVRRVAGALGAGSATAWSRDADGRLEARLRWNAAGGQRLLGSGDRQGLFVSPATVKSHLLHVYEKLGVNDRAAAVAHALRHGLIS